MRSAPIVALSFVVPRLIFSANPQPTPYYHSLFSPDLASHEMTPCANPALVPLIRNLMVIDVPYLDLSINGPAYAVDCRNLYIDIMEGTAICSSARPPYSLIWTAAMRHTITIDHDRPASDQTLWVLGINRSCRTWAYYRCREL